MAARHARLQLTELRASRTVTDVAEALGVDASTAAQVVRRLAIRLDRELGTNGALQLRGDVEIFADGIAGLVRLAPGVDLEIAPKYLDDSWEHWREDFFAIASLSRFGRLLPRDAITARTDGRGDLANLLGHAMVTTYQHNVRRPLRQYRTRSWSSFSVTGELDPESVALPEPDGFRQTQITLDRNNSYTQTIGDALAVLARDVSSNQLRRKLTTVHADLAPRTRVADRAIQHRLPSRHRRWQTMYDLARHITRGYGAAYAPEGGLPSPGFVLRTDKAWEDLLGHALRAGLEELDVQRAPTYLLGHRGGEELLAHPDYAIGLDQDVLLDAKNRSRLMSGVAIGRDDLYESLAFLRAAGAVQMILLYPRPGTASVQAVGEAQTSDEIKVGGLTVTALAVEVRGISDRNGWPEFTHRLGEAVRAQLH